MRRRISLIGVTGTALIAVSSACAEQRLIRISEETTHITRPLDAAGYVDYVEAANERASRGVTAENNFEVVVRRIAGPGEIIPDYREEYFRRLGIPAPPEVGDYFVAFDDFLEARKLPDERLDKLLESGNRLSERPWKASEYPLAAEWLQSVDKHLDAIMDGSKRSRYYTPYISTPLNDEEVYPRVISVLLPSAHLQRALGRAFATRAMLRVHDGRLDDAWSDLQALHRMARHEASGQTMIEFLVGAALESLAFNSDLQVLNSSKLTDEQARRFLADLKGLPSLPPLAEKIDTFERHALLDALQIIAQHGTGKLLEMLKLFNDLSDTTDPQRAPSGLLYVSMQRDQVQAGGDGARRPETPDWNEALKVINGWFDRLTAAARIEDLVKRRRALEEIEADLIKLKATFGNAPRTLLRRLQRGTAVGEVMVVLMLPSVTQAQTASDAARARLDLLQLAFAAEVYRRERGRYPEQLSDLAPRHVPDVPRDPLSGEPFHYEPRAEGFVLYSVGRNGQDDGGRDYADRGERDVEWDDIVVKVGPR